MLVKSRNPYWKGRLSTIDLLVKQTGGQGYSYTSPLSIPCSRSKKKMLQSWYSRTWQICSQSLQLKMFWNVSTCFLSLKKQEVNGTIKSPFSIPCPRSKKKCFRAGILAPGRYSLSRSTVKMFWNVNRFPISIAATLLVSSRRSSGTRLWLPSTKSSTKIRVTNVLPLTPNWREKHATDDLLVLAS